TAIAIVVLSVTLVLQGAAAYHFGINQRMFLIDRASRNENPAAAVTDTTDEEEVEAYAFDRAPEEQIEDDDEEHDEPRIRGLGVMHDPNDLAMGMIVALGLIGGAWKARVELRNVVLTAAAGALVYGIYLTRSRGGAVALLVVLWRFAARRVGNLPAFVLF